MSVKVSGKVWELELDPTEKLVALALAEYASHEGNNIRPGNALLCAMTGLSQPTVSAKITKFIELGLLKTDDETIGGRGQVREFSMDTDTIKRRQYFIEKEERKLKARHRFQEQQTNKQILGNAIETNKQALGIQEQNLKADSGNLKADSGNLKADTFAYKEENRHEPLENRQEERESLSESIASILCDAYENIARDYRDQTALQNQIVLLENERHSPADVKAFLAARHSLSSIGFISRDFRTWLENQRRKQQATPSPVVDDKAARVASVQQALKQQEAKFARHRTA